MDVERKIQELKDRHAATAGLVTDEELARVNVLWTKGCNMLASFYTEMETIRKKLDDDELFASWCFFRLGVGATIISNMAVVLKQQDAERVRAMMGGAKAAEKKQREEAAHAAKLEKISRDNELAAARAENAERAGAMERAGAALARSARRARDKRIKQELAEREGSPVVRAQAAWLANPMVTRDEISVIASVSHAVADAARALLVQAGKAAPKGQYQARDAGDPIGNIVNLR